MFESKSDFIKTSLLYFIKMALIIFVNPYIATPFLLATSLLIPGISSTVYINLANGICGVFTELLILYIVFFSGFYNDKKSAFKPAFLAFSAALVLQLIVAWINYFYPYTAGMSVTYISSFVYTLATGDTPKDPTSLPVYYYLIMTLITDVLRFGTVFSALAMAKRKQAKERKEIFEKPRK
ncbi:MAG: hypothetical protein IJW21_07175 [Clostridia bacterium]|nr:hypothetical protein [Clostridia bacterium]